MVLEFCSKGSLQDAMDRPSGSASVKPCRGSFRRRGTNDGSANLGAILETAVEIAGAMAHLHSLDILHGDLTAANILLTSSTGELTMHGTRGFTAKVADFGLSRISCATSTQTKTCGTISSMPPELMLKGIMTKATDVFSFGVLLHEMYTSQRAWSGLKFAQIVHTVCHEGRMLEAPYGCPPAFWDLTASCMNHNYQLRPTFASILVSLEALQQQMQEDPVSMTTQGYDYLNLL
eukprot:jgi/Astpho2/8882/e_gw1.00129.64.1_t